MPPPAAGQLRFLTVDAFILNRIPLNVLPSTALALY